MDIQIFSNNNKVSNEVEEQLKEKLILNNFNIVKTNPSLAIAIGGDGSFLRMVKKNNYNSNIIYVGINTGTLGFFQEVGVNDLDEFINQLKTKTYKIAEICIQESQIITDNKIYYKSSINEIAIREKDLNTANFDIRIDDALLEKYVGDGILIATSMGSTAYNLSFGGAIVCDYFHTLQITPIAPLNNKSYRNLLNSLIIPEQNIIEIIPTNNKTSLLLSIDGENFIYDNVKAIKTSVKNKRIKCLRLENYNFYEKINNKFISNN